MSRITADELMQWGMMNMWNEEREGVYGVRHGACPVGDFGPSTQRQYGSEDDGIDEDNFFEKAFPVLYPYGRGGIEAIRRTKVDFRSHVQWALQYHDRRFRRHETFPFVAFGILQRRQGLGSARIQMKRADFDRVSRTLSTLTVERLRKAQEEEENHQPISDAAVRLLKEHVEAVASRVLGSDQMRIRFRSQMWSSSAVLGPPALWATINPNDDSDPLAQVLAGEDISLDDFVAANGPNAQERGRTIARDPYAAAKFFHHTVRAMLETLFQIKATPFRVQSGMGVLGEVAAYFGTVESQGRGTLHLHLLIWLKHAPTTAQMNDMLRTPEFREKVKQYIKANIRAYLPGLEDADSIKQVPRSKEFAFARPPHPDSEHYAREVAELELQLARTEQVHTCQVGRCLIPNRYGQLRCKRKAPWARNEEDYVTETGEWGPARLYEYINAWNPAVTVNIRCNNDIKLLTNGEDTKNITFYVTSYSAKKQGRSHNMSALLSQGYAYHVDHPKPEYIDDLRESHRLLLFRLSTLR